MKTLVSAVFLTILLAACAPAENRRSTDPGLLSGPVDGWPRGAFSIVRAEVIGSGAPAQTTAGSVNLDGTFEITLPEPGQVSRLVSREGFGTSCAGVTVQPAEARGATLVLAVYDRVGRRQGVLVQGTNRPGSSEGGVYVSRVFADRETTITGACALESGTVTYNLRLAAGWNLSILEVRGGSRLVRNAAIPDGAAWYFLAGQ